MNISLLNQYFWPDMAATAQLLGDLSEDLVKTDVDVRVVASRGTYAVPGDPKLPGREDWRGVAIRRLTCSNFGRRSKIGRVSDYATFMMSSAGHLAVNGAPDIIVCLSTPPLLASLGWLSQRKGSRFVYKVEDLYPDVAVALGTFKKNGLADRFFSRLSHGLLARADAVVALDEAMATVLRERGARRVEVIPNWADGEAIRPDPDAGERFRREHGLEDRFVVLYSGNLGLVHRFDAVCEAARDLEGSEPNVVFLFVGGGPRLEEVRSATRDLGNVRFLPYQQRETLHELYNAADVHLITLRNEVGGLLVPSKYPAALAAGKPVLLIGGTGADLHAEIEHENVGWAIRHRRDEVVEVIQRSLRLGSEYEAICSRSRSLFDRKYSRRICTDRWRRLLFEVVGEESDGGVADA